MDKSFDHLSEPAKCGLARLLLKLPAFQRQVLIASAKEQRCLDEMLAAYEDACLALERFNKEGSAEAALIDEYKTLCDELEGDVMREVRATRF